MFEFQKQPYVVTAGTVPPAGIRLPPCIPKKSQVCDRTEHPWGVTLKEKVMRGAEDEQYYVEGPTSRERSFCVLPELKLPKKKETDAAVADVDLSLIHISEPTRPY